jgi:ribosomal-protein-alanine N-acetyltransferase
VVERALTPPAVVFREATEADHPRLARLIREWWDERPPHLERLWFRHFPATTVVGVDPEGRPMALAIGLPTAGDVRVGVLQLVAVAPKVRRRGVGREAVESVIARLRASGATSVEAAVWPGNRSGARFLEAVGFVVSPSPDGARLYGLPAIADYDGEGDDRSLFVRSLSPG